ncbi:MAG TPA: hypothetical protein VF517_09545, partial [Thermoleophilaceae bacterium]
MIAYRDPPLEADRCDRLPRAERWYCEACIASLYPHIRERLERHPDGAPTRRCASCHTPLEDLAGADLLAELAAAVGDKLGTMNFYFGPGARTAVGQ